MSYRPVIYMPRRNRGNSIAPIEVSGLTIPYVTASRGDARCVLTVNSPNDYVLEVKKISGYSPYTVDQFSGCILQIADVGVTLPSGNYLYECLPTGWFSAPNPIVGNYEFSFSTHGALGTAPLSWGESGKYIGLSVNLEFVLRARHKQTLEPIDIITPFNFKYKYSIGGN